MIPGTCRLCLQDTQLCNSHVLPEFAYKPMYDKKRFMMMKTDPHKAVQFKQKGLREHLLCQECDNVRLGRLEKYMKEIFMDGRDIKSHRCGGEIWIEGFEYAKCKLYHLSLLWRMSISDLPIFSQVSLGSQHEEQLRRRLMDDDPGEPEDYPFFAVLPTIENQWYEDYITQPAPLRIGPHRAYILVITGILYLFGTNRELVRSHLKGWKDGLLKKDGRWKILTMEAKDIPYLNTFFAQQAQAERRRKAQRQ